MLQKRLRHWCIASLLSHLADKSRKGALDSGGRDLTLHLLPSAWSSWGGGGFRSRNSGNKEVNGNKFHQGTAFQFLVLASEFLNNEWLSKSAINLYLSLSVTCVASLAQIAWECELKHASPHPALELAWGAPIAARGLRSWLRIWPCPSSATGSCLSFPVG